MAPAGVATHKTGMSDDLMLTRTADEGATPGDPGAPEMPGKPSPGPEIIVPPDEPGREAPYEPEVPGKPTPGPEIIVPPEPGREVPHHPEVPEPERRPLSPPPEKGPPGSPEVPTPPGEPRPEILVRGRSPERRETCLRSSCISTT